MTKEKVFLSIFGNKLEKSTSYQVYLTGGTSLQSCFTMSYNDLVDKLGQPNGSTDGFKTDCEWEIITPSGVVTIYNYKDGKNYNGAWGIAIKDLTNWHIGGFGSAGADYLKRFLGVKED